MSWETSSWNDNKNLRLINQLNELLYKLEKLKNSNELYQKETLKIQSIRELSEHKLRKKYGV